MHEKTFFTEGDLGPRAKEKLAELQESIGSSILKGGEIRPDLIEEAATELAEDVELIVTAGIGADEQISLILQILDAETILQRISEEHPEYKIERDHTGSGWTVVRQDKGSAFREYLGLEKIESVLMGTRRKILDRLQGRGIPVYLLASQSPESSRIWRMYDQKILKIPRDDETPDEREDRFAALRKLYETKRHPSILYAIAEVDTRSDKEQVQLEESFETLDMLMQKAGLAEAIGYFKDALEGAAFLVQNRLTLTDLSPNNIAIKEQQGKLFDFDSLHNAGFKTRFFLHNYDHDMPPKLLNRDGTDLKGKTVLTTEATMVFDLGNTLSDILSSVPRLPFVRAEDGEMLRAPGIDDLYSLIFKMRHNQPKKRPALAEAAKEVGRILNAYGADWEAATDANP